MNHLLDCRSPYKLAVMIAPLGMVFLSLGLSVWRVQAVAVTGTPLPPTPTLDRLAIPTLPANPSQQDLGREVYYYHCMPCHGDRGQGLSGEFREVWVPDHRNCWASGCHGGRQDDEGFPIPREVPALAETTGALQRFSSPEDLFAYLQQTHPPQNPGILEESQYWSVTAFLLGLNGRLTPNKRVGPAEGPTQAEQPTATPTPPPANQGDELHMPTSETIRPGVFPIGMAAGLILLLIALAWVLHRFKEEGGS